MKEAKPFDKAATCRHSSLKELAKSGGLEEHRRGA
jgi:hypothetical protein